MKHNHDPPADTRHRAAPGLLLGSWRQVEGCVQEHLGATFTHGICPDGIQKFHPEFDEASPADSRKETL